MRPCVARIQLRLYPKRGHAVRRLRLGFVGLPLHGHIQVGSAAAFSSSRVRAAFRHSEVDGGKQVGRIPAAAMVSIRLSTSR
jgi:hypothetical protein